MSDSILIARLAVLENNEAQRRIREEEKLLDELAGRAMEGLIMTHGLRPGSIEGTAKDAYGMAEAMMDERHERYSHGLHVRGCVCKPCLEGGCQFDGGGE